VGPPAGSGVEVEVGHDPLDVDPAARCARHTRMSSAARATSVALVHVDVICAERGQQRPSSATAAA
jgi:hypothetical protein